MPNEPQEEQQSRTLETRIADVKGLVKAARGVVEMRGSLVGAIAESTGLSSAGVELALTKHLEIDATEIEIRSLVEYAGTCEQVVVILSSNVFVGALRAIAIARAASNKVIVRPSRRDPAFARALVERAADPSITIDADLDVATIEKGEIHVYGRDETIADIKARVAGHPNVRMRAHGAGVGIAWISRYGPVEVAARGLADDVVVFDQRGCLSPRVVLVEGDSDRTDVFAEALHAELERLTLTIPRGPLPAEERAASDRYIATMTYACRALVGTDHAIGIAPPGAPLVASPAYRHVHIAACNTRNDARALIEPLWPSIVAIGSDDIEIARTLAPSWARVSALGRMQRPALDGPVDRREQV